MAWVHPRQINMAMTRKSTQHRQVRRHCMSLQHCRQQGGFGEDSPVPSGSGSNAGKVLACIPQGAYHRGYAKGISAWRLGEAPVMQVTPQRCGREGCPQRIRIEKGEGSASARIPKWWDNEERPFRQITIARVGWGGGSWRHARHNWDTKEVAP